MEEERFLEFGVFDIVSSSGVDADTEEDIASNFQIWDKMESTVAAGRVDVFYEGRLNGDQTEIEWIKVPIMGSSGSQIAIQVFTEANGTANQYTGTYASQTNAPTSRAVEEISSSQANFTDYTPTGEKRFYVRAMAYIDAGEVIYVGRPYAKLK